MQHAEFNHEDISVQHTGFNHEDISIQHEAPERDDISVQHYPDQHEASIQHSLVPSQADASIQPSDKLADKSIAVSYRVKSVGLQEVAENSDK